MTQNGGWEKGGGGGGRNPDGPTPSLAILTCKGRLFTHVFSRTVLVFLYSFFFFSSFNNSDVRRFIRDKKRTKKAWQCAK